MIHTVLTTVFDTLFPPAPEVLALRGISTEQFLCYRERHQLDGVIILSRYSEHHIRAAIHAHKFYSDKHARRLLTTLLKTELTTLAVDTYLIPIPLARGRIRERGYNQVSRLLSCCGTQQKIIENLLIRTRETVKQSHLPKKDRQKNMRGAFGYNVCYPPHQFENARLIIVDDVVTTGATLREAVAALRRALPSSATISCLALAH
ncbi:hypothetical protein K2Q16_02225 [Patescibacteria group bacterium]|nr:hypothetical protein [Patescibacteria group bacterium]